MELAEKMVDAHLVDVKCNLIVNFDGKEFSKEAEEQQLRYVDFVFFHLCICK
jgi:hypothetical protein